MPKTITVQEAAARLDVSKATIVRAVHSGKLRATFAGLLKNRIKGVVEESVEAIRAQTANAATAARG